MRVTIKGYTCQNNLAEAIKVHKNHPSTKAVNTQDIKIKATAFIQDGLFIHHKSFYYTEGEYLYYKEFFGNGWHKRKINKDGWVKYQNALAYNAITHQVLSRKDALGDQCYA